MDQETRHNSSVSIDGEAVRRIREEKRLTQLYVAKVVGVTTDTVSRWENNRYPTMRRDNALKLAEALEVSLPEILKQDEEPESTAPAESRRRPLWIWLSLLLVLGGLVGGVIWSLRPPDAPPIKIDAERLLPPYAAPGSRILVRVRLTAEKPIKGMILREQFPPGWTLFAAEPSPASLDNETGRARWIFRNPKLSTTVAYLLNVPEDSVIGTDVKITGELIVNPEGRAGTIVPKNSGVMQVQRLHWADTNGNQIIDDLEILDVSYLFDEIGELPLDWDHLEELWDAGGYRWDPKKHEFVPHPPSPKADESKQ